MGRQYMHNNDFKSELSGKPKCSKCGGYFKDLDGHVLRKHKTTLVNL
ncbi:18147_t:CDS:2 [Gigaspora rosea]|nr:18147_t:CDS:2 [Gigaspora rosea]